MRIAPRLFQGLLAAAVVLVALPAAAQPAPPTVAKHAHTVEAPAGGRNDDYYWLRDDTRKNPDMLAYLAAENAYADASLAHTKALQDKLYGEIVGRVKQDDSSVPVAGAATGPTPASSPGSGLYPVMACRAGAAERAGRGDAGRAGHGRRQGLLRGGQRRGQPGQPPAGLGRRHGGPPAICAAVQGPAHRPDARRHGHQCGAQPHLGRRQQDRLLHREGPGHASVQAGEGPRPGNAGLSRPPGL